MDADASRAPFPSFDRERQLNRYRSTINHPERLDAWYKDARKKADAWRKSRNVYLLKRLKAGVHPDDDPEFWNGWKDEHPAPATKLKKSGWFW